MRPVLLQIRCLPILLQGDLTSFFPSFDLIDRDKSLRRMLISKVGYGLERDLVLEDVTEVIQSKMGFGDHSATPLAVS